MSDSGLGRVLDEIVTYLRRFVVLGNADLDALALWVFHGYTIEAADTTPYISVTSAEKRSGKTRLLEALELLVREPLPTANISDAALFRAVAELHPTLLLDEIDSVFGPKARDREDLRGLLNAGYRRGAVVRRMGGANNTKLEAFPVFCAKVFAGIGELPDTLRDRSIRIRLQRRTRDEPIERFRRREAEEQAELIRISCDSLAQHHLPALVEARPSLPLQLDDRAQDSWEPLLGIADEAGADWPKRARRAAVELSTGEAREDESLTALLLRDVHRIFSTTEARRYKTSDLIDALAEIEESPWGDWFGRTITPQALSKLLRPHRIRTMSVKVDGETVRGYKSEQFDEAFARVLGVTGVTSVTSQARSQAGSNGSNAGNAVDANRRLLGDPGYAMQADRDFANGQITEVELAHLLKLDALLSRVPGSETLAA